MANDQSNFHGVGMTGIQLVPVRSEDCDNGADDDGDGDVDCEDSDCPACPEICDNGIDDDRDGKADCRDLDCPAAPRSATTASTMTVTATSTAMTKTAPGLNPAGSSRSSGETRMGMERCSLPMGSSS